jgi:hypothetical protein
VSLNIIYSCYWGGYLGVVAASLHLGVIKGKEEIIWHKVLQIPNFGGERREQLGKIIYMGTDEKGRRVFIMASKKSGEVVRRALLGMADIYGIKREFINYVDLKTVGNIFTALGIFIMRRTGLIGLGAWIFCLGIKINYEKINLTIKKCKGE